MTFVHFSCFDSVNLAGSALTRAAPCCVRISEALRRSQARPDRFKGQPPCALCRNWRSLLCRPLFTWDDLRSRWWVPYNDSPLKSPVFVLAGDHRPGACFWAAMAGARIAPPNGPEQTFSLVSGSRTWKCSCTSRRLPRLHGVAQLQRCGRSGPVWQG